MPRAANDATSPPEVTVQVGQNTVDFDDLEASAWDEFTPSALNPTHLTRLSWHLVGGEVSADYDFCLSNVEPI